MVQLHLAYRCVHSCHYYIADATISSRHGDGSRGGVVVGEGVSAHVVDWEMATTRHVTDAPITYPVLEVRF